MTTVFAENQLPKERAIVESKQPITPSFYNGAIHLSDLSTSAATGGAMYTINAPGRYYIASDLGIAPSNSQVAAIKITASNVFLDMNEATIYQRTGNSQTGLMGIEVDSSIANVTILNGKINGLNVSDSTEQNAGVVIGSSANNITIEDVVVFGCTSATNEVAGFLLNSCNNISLINCSANNNTNTLATATSDNGTVSGFKLSSSADCILQNCYANRNASTDQNGYGFKLTSSTYNKILNCTALNQISTSNDSGDSAVGFYSTDGTGNSFNGCESIGNVGSSSAVASNGIGFYLAGTEKYSSIINCAAIGNGCAATNTSGVGYGIWMPSGVTYCEIRNNRLLSNYGYANSYGIYDDTATTIANLYVNNFAHGNVNNAGTVNNYAFTVTFTSSKVSATYNALTNLATAQGSFYNVDVTKT